jgi:hypothetical protein
MSQDKHERLGVLFQIVLKTPCFIVFEVDCGRLRTIDEVGLLSPRRTWTELFGFGCSFVSFLFFFISDSPCPLAQNHPHLAGLRPGLEWLRETV